MPEAVESAQARVSAAVPFRAQGAVRRVVGLAVESDGPAAAVGEECLLLDAAGRLLSRTQVVGFSGNRLFSMPMERLDGVQAGAKIVALRRRPSITLGEHVLGRVLDADGFPIDGGPGIPHGELCPVEADPPQAMQRGRICERFATGVRSIDSMLTLGVGQRVGIFAGSGVGKSTLLGMIARHADADVVVIGLVGERGREVRDFLENDLGPEGLRRAVVFVSTSDEPPMRRVRATQAATAAAEYFRDQGKKVVLMMDSITRVAMAQREIGLSLGEPPATKGYPPSTFALLPRLLERAGSIEGGGSITGIYTVYVEGDDLNDPISDATRSLLDGHLVLSRDLADRGHYPAVDILASVSRLMPQVAEPDHLSASRLLRARLAAMKDAEDLVMLGAYQAGSNPDVDAAIASQEAIRRLLVQEVDDGTPLDASLQALNAAVAES